ncbi:hypothetical protein BTW08_10560 [Salinicola sp. MH3R3-1]|uniref:hypothetical protein n=1 Tax=Salinicola sp. MH3R3-1 TaxID=1928762 RepID=UPI00094ECB8A|nr:hypothetical protein [Salinicola sp. MH3R3-1]OLO07795.1 hypothetical protein BTW08_10560 [Salinicola sp. MH3R3-1]
MSQSPKTPSAQDVLWDSIEAENSGRIAQLESQIQALKASKASGLAQRSNKALAEELAEQHQSLTKLEDELADAARRFERRFDAIAMMDIKPRFPETLKKQYGASALATEPDDFVLYRIIGNDLYPRHRKGQSRDNLRFILENEQPLEGCKKRWVVNRIADPAEESAILTLLEAHHQEWIHIPFSAEEYRRIPLDFDCLPSPGYLASAEFAKLGPEQRQRLLTALYRFKNNYVMNNNGARNRALEAGLGEAKWVLPWDGNCFLTPRAWNRIVEDVRERPWLAYYAVPMTRVLDNQRLVDDHFEPEAVEEPQLIFRNDADERFNEAFCYGRRPKVELFWRLGIPGKWDRWKDDAWEQPRRELGPEAGQFGVAGWVARLYSGMGSLEIGTRQSARARYLVRQEAILSALQSLDYGAFVPNDGISTIKTKGVDEIQRYAEKCDLSLNHCVERAGRIVSDVDKNEAPFLIEGKGFLQDSLVLSLAWSSTQDFQYLKSAAKLYRRHFYCCTPSTDLIPENSLDVTLELHKTHLAFGGLEALAYFQVVTILVQNGLLSPIEKEIFDHSLAAYINRLWNDKRRRVPQHFTPDMLLEDDLRLLRLLSDAGEYSKGSAVVIESLSSFDSIIAEDGTLPTLLSVRNSRSSVAKILRTSVDLAAIAEVFGINYLEQKLSNGRSLSDSLKWFLSYGSDNWPFCQRDEFDQTLLDPLQAALKNNSFR